MIQLTIIIPHKNIPKLLERCLQSIPDREDIQVIVIDDNSSSHIVESIQILVEKRLFTQIYKLKEGKGAGHARNIGLMYAKGKWILFADADDFFYINFIDIIYQYIGTDNDVILFPIKIVDSDTLKEDCQRDTWINETILNTALTEREKLAIVTIPSSKLIKRNLIEKEHILFEKIPHANDVLFSLQVAIFGKKIVVDSQHYIYTLTVRKGSLTTIKNIDAFRCRLETSIRGYKYLKEKKHPDFMTQVNYIYLPWASTFGKKELFRTTWILFKSGLLFYRSKYSWTNKYYNKWWYHLYRAFLHNNR